jgi:hypothetical protein
VAKTILFVALAIMMTASLTLAQAQNAAAKKICNCSQSCAQGTCTTCGKKSFKQRLNRVVTAVKDHGSFRPLHTVDDLPFPHAEFIAPEPITGRGRIFIRNLCYNKFMKKLWTAIGIIVGVGCIILAFMYWTTPAGSLPTYFPGFISGSTEIHVKHGLAALVVGLAALAFAWFQSNVKKAS